MNRIITISREFGSGGRTIGKRVAEKRGISCYDAELIEKIVEKTGFSKEYIEEHGEHASGANWFDWAFGARDFKGHSFQDDLYTIQCKIIRELAEKESCTDGICEFQYQHQKNPCFQQLEAGMRINID